MLFEFLLGLPVEFNIRPRRFPVVTVCLLAINVVVFVLALWLGGIGSWIHLASFRPAFPQASGGDSS